MPLVWDTWRIGLRGTSLLVWEGWGRGGCLLSIEVCGFPVLVVVRGAAVSDERAVGLFWSGLGRIDFYV